MADMWRYNYFINPHLGFWGPVTLGLLNVLFWCPFIALVIWFIFRFGKANSSVTKQTPIDIAKERYAKGEITQDQPDQIKKDLNE
jgi:putative membrane protein